MNNLKDKVVLITGAGKGSGRALAKAFAERGAVVAANDISPVNLEQVVEDITNKGGRARAYIEDIAKKVGAQNLIKQVEDEFGRIDILINHASVRPRVSLLDTDEWDWHRVLDVNLTGAFLMTQSVGRVMRGQGWGVIINLLTRDQEPAENETAFFASMQGWLASPIRPRANWVPLGSESTQRKQGKTLSKRYMLYWRKNERVEGVS
jgi:NAD(P)-dependent dehydrogenase (short-subunit alcohol dehydrogenase family)